MMSRLYAFFRDKTGATAIEYGLIAALISLALIATFSTFTDKFKNLYESIGSTMDNKGK